MKRKLSIIVIYTLVICGCKKMESIEKNTQSRSSDLNRILNIYPYGSKEILATYEGKIKVYPNEEEKLLFSLDGKWYEYYHVTAEVIEK